MANEESALLAGATGLVGGHCLRLLLEQGYHARVVALVRRRLDLTHPRLEQRVVDFERLEGEEPIAAADVFCALGTTLHKAGSQEAFRKVDHSYAKAVAELAVKGGGERFVLVSSVGADPGAGSFYLRVKGELERDVNAMPFEAVHALRPSFLLGDRGERRVGEAIGVALARGVRGALLGGLRKYRPIEASVVAAAMIGAARRGAPGRHVHHFDEIHALAAG